MEEKDFNESNDETRARGVKRTSDTKIAEVSSNKAMEGKDFNELNDETRARRQENFKR
jgi:hypothetical protein